MTLFLRSAKHTAAGIEAAYNILTMPTRHMPVPQPWPITARIPAQDLPHQHHLVCCDHMPDLLPVQALHAAEWQGSINS